MPDNPAAVLEVRGLKKFFPVRRGLLRRTVGHVHAVDDVSFTIGPAETVGLVGESGCGKTTVGRTILRLIEPTAGSIRLEGQEIAKLSKRQLRPLRQRMQIIFQASAYAARRWTTIRTNSPAGSGSASAWHGRSRSIHA